MKTLQSDNELMSKKSTLFQTRYLKLHVLGKGNFGKVYLAEHRTTKEKVAIKVVDKRAFQKSDQIQHAESEQSLCEAFATRMKHKHIVDVHEVIADDHSIYIVMEYMQGGDLFEQIRQSAYIAEPVARRWFREIMEAVHFIHSHGIVHRDLKPENVLIDKRQHLRLCDFGFGKKVAMQQQVLKTYCGSPFYASPEMVTATPYKGPPVDMWSCGVILYLMLTGTLPFQASNMGQLFRKISVAQYTIPRSVSPDASNLIHRLLCKNSRERITAIQCLQHPWLAPSAPPLSRYTLLMSSQLTLTEKSKPALVPRKHTSYDAIYNKTVAVACVSKPHDTSRPITTAPKKSQVVPSTTKSTPFTEKEAYHSEKTKSKGVVRFFRKAFHRRPPQ